MTEPTAPEAAPPTILIVDDDDDLRPTLVRALTGSGYRVLDADSAERGLQLAEDSPSGVQLALLDIVLPDSWGAQLVSGLKLVSPEVRVIYTSGYTASDPVLEAAIDPGTPFLHKPFDVKELLSLVATLLPGAARAE